MITLISGLREKGDGHGYNDVLRWSTVQMEGCVIQGCNSPACELFGTRMGQHAAYRCVMSIRTVHKYTTHGEMTVGVRNKRVV